VREERVLLEDHVQRPLVGVHVGHVGALGTIRPESGRSKPAIIRSVVVLPQPDGPRAEELAVGDVDGDVLDGVVSAEALGHVLKGDRDRGARSHGLA
jgi:hypothetical protein